MAKMVSKVEFKIVHKKRTSIGDSARSKPSNKRKRLSTTSNAKKENRSRKNKNGAEGN